MQSTEAITLRARDGACSDGQAQLTRWPLGVRAGRASAIAASGVLAGAASVIIPAVHLVSTWLIPLLSFGIAAYVLQVRARVDRIEGVCPKCGETLSAGPFGAATDDEPLWVRCPSCTLPLEVRWSA